MEDIPWNSDILLVIITGIYAIFTFLIWRANSHSLKEVRLSRELAYRPEVIGFIREEGAGLHFRLKNIGSRLAFNITVKFDPLFNFGTYLENNGFLTIKMGGESGGSYGEKYIHTLAPEQHIEGFVDFQMNIMQLYEKSIKENENNKGMMNSTIHISYYDYEGQLYQEKYSISLLGYSPPEGLTRYKIHDAVLSLKQIDGTLKAMNKKK